MAGGKGIRAVENRPAHFLYGYGSLALHATLTVVMVLFMLYFVDGIVVDSADGKRRRNGRPWLRVSDITTLVSLGLMMVRFVSTTWTVMSAWRCAFILLETDGLTLHQFNYIVSRRVHWPKWSKFHLTSAVVLLAMVPSIFVGPVLAGAVNWQDSYMIINTKQVMYRTAMIDDYWYWFIADLGTRKDLALRATGFSTLAWANVDHTSKITCRHAMLRVAEMPINSTISGATMPCMEIHNISWDDPLDEDVQSILKNTGSSITQIQDPPLQYYHQGNAALLEPIETSNWAKYAHGDVSPVRTDIPPQARFTGVKKVAVSIARQASDCLIYVPGMFGNETTVQKYIMHSSHGNCYRIGTVNFTAGVVQGPDATYVSPRVIEYKGNPEILPHHWVMPALSFLSDVMVRVSGANSTSVASWDNIDEYTKGLIQQSYMGTWDAMNEDFSRDRVDLTAQEKARLLQATVSIPRVLMWVAAQVLVTISGVILWFMQRRVNRPVVIDVAAVSLMIDSKPVLETDTGGLTCMSYVSKKDCGELLHLREVDGTSRFELSIADAKEAD